MTEQDRRDALQALLPHYSHAELYGELRRRRENDVTCPWPLKVLLAPYWAVRWCWRHITFEGAKKFALLCAGALLVIAIITPIQQQVQLRRQNAVLAELKVAATERARSATDTKKIIESTDKTVKAIEDATSEEAKAEQAALYDRLVATIDCNSQINVQRLADELKKLNIPPEGSIVLITEACRRQRDEQSS